MSSFVQMIARAQQGDAPAMEELLHQFDPVIRRECERFNVQAAVEISHSDLQQEVWIRVWSRIDQFELTDDDYTRIKFSKWLKVTARTTAIRILQKRAAQKRRPNQPPASIDHYEPAADADATPQTLMQDREDVDRINHAIGQLAPEQRDIIRDHYFAHLTLGEIGQLRALTYDQVRHRLRQAIRVLESKLASP